MSSSATAIICLGMDVHKESITIAVLPASAKTPTRQDRLPNDPPQRKRWLEHIARDRVTLAAGVTLTFTRLVAF